MPQIHQPEIVTLEPCPVAVVRETVRVDALPGFFDKAFGAVAQTAGAQGVPFAGPPLGVYFGMPTETIDVAAGFPTVRPVSPAAGVTTLTLPGGSAVQVLHEGTYDEMTVTYSRLMEWMAEHGLTPGAVMWESYLTEPDPDAPEATRTLIVWPITQPE